MKKLVFVFSFLLSLACASVLPTVPTPNDFPPPPMTVIVDFPTPGFITPTLEPRLQPITEEKMSDARTFFLILSTRVAAGDDHGVAESVFYPIEVNINGTRSIATVDEFVQNYDKIFNGTVLNAIINTNEEDLIHLPDGIRVGQGEIWFNLFCMDAACADAQFLITQINN